MVQHAEHAFAFDRQRTGRSGSDHRRLHDRVVGAVGNQCLGQQPRVVEILGVSGAQQLRLAAAADAAREVLEQRRDIREQLGQNCHDCR